MKNETNEQISSTNTPISKNFKPTTLTENINHGTINSANIENGPAELVLIPPFESDDGGISVACVGGEECATLKHRIEKRLFHKLLNIYPRKE